MTDKIYVAVGFTLSLAACGARTSFDDDARAFTGHATDVESDAAEPDLDAGPGGAGPDGADASDASSRSDAGRDASDASSPRDAGRQAIDIVGLLPVPESGPGSECAGCVKTECSNAINGCLNDSQCIQGVGCALVQCSANGGANAGSPIDSFGCLAGCFQGDLGSTTLAMASATCLAKTCSEPCNSLLPDGVADVDLADGGADPVPEPGDGSV
jgi:hypothetical protein